MQERDEHAPEWPDMWGFPGGALEADETPAAGAVRELAEETGIVTTAEQLDDLGHFEQWGSKGLLGFRCCAVPTDLGDGDVECREGRRMVFVDPATLDGLSLAGPAVTALPAVLEWAATHTPEPPPDARGFAGVVLVDR